MAGTNVNSSTWSMNRAFTVNSWLCCYFFPFIFTYCEGMNLSGLMKYGQKNHILIRLAEWIAVKNKWLLNGLHLLAVYISPMVWYALNQGNVWLTGGQKYKIQSRKSICSPTQLVKCARPTDCFPSHFKWLLHPTFKSVCIIIHSVHVTYKGLGSRHLRSCARCTSRTRLEGTVSLTGDPRAVQQRKTGMKMQTDRREDAHGDSETDSTEITVL